MFRLRPVMRGLCRTLFVGCALVLCGVLTTEAQTSAPDPCASSSNTSCDACLRNTACLWCFSTRQCIEYTVRTALPHLSVCPLDEARWGVCWVNFRILIITMAALVGATFLALLICFLCCCKCLRSRKKKSIAAAERKTRPRRTRAKDRKADMQFRHDEIRQKYAVR
ncbi:PTTG1 interacting protein b isoform X2 [Genypterus blacodes]|uniref:PTTG1 interacting protein b isoform X2 n=1 Tax=Genypterus blacodes TaxID=154954 RepID=UPI003F7638F6